MAVLYAAAGMGVVQGRIDYDPWDYADRLCLVGVRGSANLTCSALQKDGPEFTTSDCPVRIVTGWFDPGHNISGSCRRARATATNAFRSRAGRVLCNTDADLSSSAEAASGRCGGECPFSSCRAWNGHEGELDHRAAAKRRPGMAGVQEPWPARGDDLARHLCSRGPYCICQSLSGRSL